MSHENYPTNWDYKYLAIADFMGSMSKCAAKQVGCVITKGEGIISSGVNGTPSGYINCNSVYTKEGDTWFSVMGSDKTKHITKSDGTIMYALDDLDMDHKSFSTINEIHAEVNAISKAAKIGISTEGCKLYCNYSPCVQCAKSIIASGISQVYYITPFDDVQIVESFMRNNGVNIDQLNIK